MQRKLTFPALYSVLMAVAFLVGATSAGAQTGTAVWGPASVATPTQNAKAPSSQAVLNGVPVKNYHLKAMGKTMECKTCHQGVAVPTQRPDDKACIACHGPMESIKTKENATDKYPHKSHHYGDLLQCSACHAEHKPSRALCDDCHVPSFPNLK